MKNEINEDVGQILLGSLLGDGAVYYNKGRYKNKAFYSEVHSINQKEYALWKNVRLFEKLCTRTRTYQQYEKEQEKYYSKINQDWA